MPVLERCVHQILNPVWERCKDCAYDSENNKKCPAYSPTAYDISENKIESNMYEQSKLNVSALPVL